MFRDLVRTEVSTAETDVIIEAGPSRRRVDVMTPRLMAKVFAPIVTLSPISQPSINFLAFSRAIYDMALIKTVQRNLPCYVIAVIDVRDHVHRLMEQIKRAQWEAKQFGVYFVAASTYAEAVRIIAEADQALESSDYEAGDEESFEDMK